MICCSYVFNYFVHNINMLNINIIKDKSDLYFKNNLNKDNNTENDSEQKKKFYHFVSSLCQRVISNDTSDFNREEQELIERYNIDVGRVLDYFKVDIKNFYVESGNINNN